ncbi:MAG: isoleucine--tRNA ligase [Bdellovibrionales bacterium RIFOXYB1_FULL_37_110]|nr:MAG: isoleucine--tRNA ligase [Bdellovibrionales bacterium RIFOXYA1_FULL_38_20]OFZ45491.1 MAG: isoleucine--tRNA ligase [Bdellovibrionales bacterium RIFOXYC1_FULL_37_79]OFZ60638.1 MAG: isoleucine--tRNA ligase [Bdellovibrionales bacterium RIFOXYB1_FULL_37_110]OFZ63446.1 MAG: isoleucine--tRNA ligase [Bdellovibrionales bacterium RIFOXYD1_FULL_36_51]
MSESSSPQGSFSFVEAEHEVLKFWKEKNIFKKSLEKTKKGKPYIFYDGPPFATGLPHHGHLVANTLKDVVPRYFTMKGRYVERRFGWDCHGLPIEHEIDKKLKMPAHEAVKKLGVLGYNNECRSIVDRYTSEWEKTITRIGRWVDFKNDYKTMDPNFMESVWSVFKSLWDNGLIYRGVKVVPFSTAFGTVLSNFEATSNYKDVQDPAITIFYKLSDEDTYLAIWTTTPWTLPSNLAICVGEDIVYTKVKDETYNVNFLIAKDRLGHYQKIRKKKLQVISEIMGRDLKGKRYEPLFPYFKHLKKDGAFQVVCDSYVTTSDGTGLVHTAPDFGEDDNRVMKEHNLHVHACPVDDHGKFTDEVTDFKGMYVKDADKLIIKWLKDNNLLYDQDTVVHSYPFCERSDTPLIYKAIPSWYVNVESIKDKVINANKEILWVPGHIKDGRFGKWLEGAKDWAISRNRIWGTPLPIWKNETSEKYICIGSIAELEKYSKTKINDLHRENVDPLEFSIEGEKGVYRRIPEVLDCWFESGSMPYAQLHYPFENKAIFEAGFPAEFIAEGLDQTRGWFYTLTVLSAALYNKPAFKNVIVNGIVMAEDGKKMSKSLKNYTAPDLLMEEFGADALRLYLINSGLVRAEEQRFSDAGVKDMVRRALLPWYNSFKFFHTYANVDQWKYQKHFKSGNNITDKWILSNLQTLKKNISKEMEIYRLYNVVPALFNFIEDLTNWYIRLNRSRFWGEGLTDDKCACYSTLYTTLKELSLAMAPFAPFLSEYIYQELGKFSPNKEESVHLETYPVEDEKLIKPGLEDAVSRMQQIILLGRQKRNQIQVKVKTPLKRLTILHKDQATLNEIKKLEDYIKVELNIKEIQYSTKESDYINLFAKPNSPVLGKKLGKRFAEFRQKIETLPADILTQLEAGNTVNIAGEDFTQEDVLIFREAKPGTQALSNRSISIDMDCQLSEELISEGLAREIVNRIQKTRKEINLNVSDRIKIIYDASSDVEKAIIHHKDHISKETLTVSLTKGSPSNKNSFHYDIDSDFLKIEIIKA